MENYEDLIRDFSTFKLVFDFVKSLHRSNEETWTDEYGITVISLGRNLVSNLLQEWDKESLSYAVILSPIIKGQVDVFSNHIFTSSYSKDVNIILSIGGALEHNIAREFLFKKKWGKQSQLATVPVPLTNDSFGTNRSSPNFGKVEFPSRETLYPSKIIINFNFLDCTNTQVNINGIGEVIGLYYSLYDYYLVRRLSPPECLIENVERDIHNLIISLKEKKATWMKLLAINLIEKCLIMRVVKDNQIGAGGDHLIAYALGYHYRNDKDSNYRMLPHGKLVYLGSVTMASLFPEWEYKFFSLEKLIDVGIRIGILKFEDLNLLVNMLNNELIALALQMRPSRATSLSILSSVRIRNSRSRINKIFKGNFR